MQQIVNSIYVLCNLKYGTRKLADLFLFVLIFSLTQSYGKEIIILIFSNCQRLSVHTIGKKYIFMYFLILKNNQIVQPTLLYYYYCIPTRTFIKYVTRTQMMYSTCIKGTLTDSSSVPQMKMNIHVIIEIVETTLNTYEQFRSLFVPIFNICSVC